MSKNRLDFWRARLFSSQSEIFVTFLNYSDWLDKSWLFKNDMVLLLWACKRAIKVSHLIGLDMNCISGAAHKWAFAIIPIIYPSISHNSS